MDVNVSTSVRQFVLKSFEFSMKKVNAFSLFVIFILTRILSTTVCKLLKTHGSVSTQPPCESLFYPAVSGKPPGRLHEARRLLHGGKVTPPAKCSRITMPMYLLSRCNVTQFVGFLSLRLREKGCTSSLCCDRRDSGCKRRELVR